MTFTLKDIQDLLDKRDDPGSQPTPDVQPTSGGGNIGIGGQNYSSIQDFYKQNYYNQPAQQIMQERQPASPRDYLLGQVTRPYGPTTGFDEGRYRQPGDTYWQNPQTIARWRNAIHSLPFGSPAPSWVDKDLVEFAYEYYNQMYQGTPYYLWAAAMHIEDPMRNVFKDLPAPPSSYLLDSETAYLGEAQRTDAALFKDVVDSGQVYPPGTQVNEAGEVYMPGSETNEFGYTPEQWEGMEGWERGLVQGMANSSIAAAAQGTVLGGLRGGWMGALSGLLAGTFLGTLVNGEAEKEARSAAGESVSVITGYGRMMGDETKQKEYEQGTYKSPILSVLRFMDAGALPIERGMGLIVQLADSIQTGAILNPQDNRYDSFEEFMQFMNAAYKAGDVTYDVLTSSNLTSVTGYERMMGKELPADENEAYLKAYRIGIDEHMITPLEGEGTAMVRMIDQVRNAILEEGMTPQEVNILMQQTTGLGGQMTDLAGHIFLDLLNVKPQIESYGAMQAIKLTNDATDVKKAADMAADVNVKGGALRYMQIYGAELRKLPSEQLAELGPISRYFAGVDEAGKLNLLKARAEGTKNITHLWQLTNQSQALEVSVLFADSTMRLLDQYDDPGIIVKTINGIAQGDPELYGAASRLVPWIKSAEGEVYPLALRDYKIDELILEQWYATRPKMNMLQEVADILKKDPRDIVGRIDAGDAAKVLEEYKALKGGEIDLRVEDLEDIANLVTKDMVAINVDEFKGQIFVSMVRHMDNWAAKYFKVTPDAGWVRFSNLTKSAQSFLVLGGNPITAANNFLDNVTTLAWDGLLGFRTPKSIDEFWDKKGITLARLQQGFTGYDVGTEAVAGVAKGVQVGGEIIKAKKVPLLKRTLVDQAQGFFQSDTVKKIQFATKWMGAIEESSGKQALTEGFSQAWQNWQMGKWNDPLPVALEAELRRINPELPGFVQDTIRTANRPQEIDRIWTGMERKTIESLASTVANDVGLPEESVRTFMDTFIAPEYRKRLEKATTDAEYRSAVIDLRTDINKRINEMVESQVEKIAEGTAEKTRLEGLQSGYQELGEVVIDIETFWTKHSTDWGLVMDRTSGMSRKDISRIVRAQDTVTSMEWKRTKDIADAKVRGVIRGMGADDPTIQRLENSLINQRQIWDVFFREQKKARNAYFDEISVNKKLTADERSAMWEAYEIEQNKAAALTYEAEIDLQMEIDEIYVEVFEKQFDGGGKIAESWRSDTLEVRKKMRDAQSTHRDNMVGMSGAARRQAWKTFEKDTWNPLIKELGETSLEGIRKFYEDFKPEDSIGKSGIVRKSIPEFWSLVEQSEITSPAEWRATYKILNRLLDPGDVPFTRLDCYRTLSVEEYAKLEKVVGRLDDLRKAAEAPKPPEGPLETPPDVAVKPAEPEGTVSDIQGVTIKFEPIPDKPGYERVTNLEYEGIPLQEIKDHYGFESDDKLGLIRKIEIPEGPPKPTGEIAEFVEGKQVAAEPIRITDKTRKQLAGLGYSEAQIARMIPEDAARIIGEQRTRPSINLASAADKDVEAIGFTHSFHAMNAVNKALGTEYKTPADVPWEEVLQVARQRYTDQPELIDTGTGKALDHYEGIVNRLYASEQPLPEEISKTISKVQAQQEITMFAGRNRIVSAEPQQIRGYFREAALELMVESPKQVDGVMGLMDAKARMYGLQNGVEDSEWWIQRIRGIRDADQDLTPKEVIAKAFVEINDGNAVIHALGLSDVSSLVHEIGHIFRRDLQIDDINIFRTWLKNTHNVDIEYDATTGRFIDTPEKVTFQGVEYGKAEYAEEMFARGWEQYLREGIAPTAGLQKIFSMFSEWLRTIYKTLAGSDIDVKIDDNMRGIYDRLLSENPIERITLENVEYGNRTFALVPGEDKYWFRYALVELDDLVTSHLKTGDPNPRYYSVLQERLRDRAASQIQIGDISQNLDVDEVLTDFHVLGRGPSKIGADGMVEDGNGRIMAILMARDMFPEKYQRYQDTLKSQLDTYGIDPKTYENYDNPGLVLIRETDVDRAKFAALANDPTGLGMSAVELANKYMKALSDEHLAAFHVGENLSAIDSLKLAENREMVSDFIGKLPKNASKKLLDKNGNVSLEGYRVMQYALFAKAYPGDAGMRLLAQIAETQDVGMKNIENAMMRSLGSSIRLEAGIEAGKYAPELSITEDIAAAVDMYMRLKQNDMSIQMYVGNLKAFGEELTPLQLDLLKFADDHKRSAKPFAELINRYTEQVMEMPDQRQQGLDLGIEMPERAGKEDYVRGIIGSIEKEIADEKAARAAARAAKQAKAIGNQAIGETGETAAKIAGISQDTGLPLEGTKLAEPDSPGPPTGAAAEGPEYYNQIINLAGIWTASGMANADEVVELFRKVYGNIEDPRRPRMLSAAEAEMEAQHIIQLAESGRDKYLADILDTAKQIEGVKYPEGVEEFAVKGQERIMVKLMDGRHITDSLRTTLVVTDLGKIEPALAHLYKKGYETYVNPYRLQKTLFGRLRVKPTEDITNLYQTTDNGYRHFSIKLVQGQNDPVIKELQIMTPHIWEAKKKLGWHLYSAERLTESFRIKYPALADVLHADEILMESMDILYSGALYKDVKSSSAMSASMSIKSAETSFETFANASLSSLNETLKTLEQPRSAAASISSLELKDMPVPGEPVFESFKTALSSTIDKFSDLDLSPYDTMPEGLLFQRGKAPADMMPTFFDETAEDMPLFSGTAQKAQGELFAPKEEGNKQLSMFSAEPGLEEGGRMIVVRIAGAGVNDQTVIPFGNAGEHLPQLEKLADEYPGAAFTYQIKSADGNSVYKTGKDLTDLFPGGMKGQMELLAQRIGRTGILEPTTAKYGPEYIFKPSGDEGKYIDENDFFLPAKYLEDYPDHLLLYRTTRYSYYDDHFRKIDQKHYAYYAVHKNMVAGEKPWRISQFEKSEYAGKSGLFPEGHGDFDTLLEAQNELLGQVRDGELLGVVKPNTFPSDVDKYVPSIMKQLIGRNIDDLIEPLDNWEKLYEKTQAKTVNMFAGEPYQYSGERFVSPKEFFKDGRNTNKYLVYDVGDTFKSNKSANLINKGGIILAGMNDDKTTDIYFMVQREDGLHFLDEFNYQFAKKIVKPIEAATGEISALAFKSSANLEYQRGKLSSFFESDPDFKKMDTIGVIDRGRIDQLRIGGGAEMPELFAQRSPEESTRILKEQMGAWDEFGKFDEGDLELRDDGMYRKGWLLPNGESVIINTTELHHLDVFGDYKTPFTNGAIRYYVFPEQSRILLEIAGKPSIEQYTQIRNVMEEGNVTAIEFDRAREDGSNYDGRIIKSVTPEDTYQRLVDVVERERRGTEVFAQRYTYGEAKQKMADWFQEYEDEGYDISESWFGEWHDPASFDRGFIGLEGEMFATSGMEDHGWFFGGEATDMGLIRYYTSADWMLVDTNIDTLDNVQMRAIENILYAKQVEGNPINEIRFEVGRTYEPPLDSGATGTRELRPRIRHEHIDIDLGEMNDIDDAINQMREFQGNIKTRWDTHDIDYFSQRNPDSVRVDHITDQDAEHGGMRIIANVFKDDKLLAYLPERYDVLEWQEGAKQNFRILGLDVQDPRYWVIEMEDGGIQRMPKDGVELPAAVNAPPGTMESISPAPVSTAEVVAEGYTSMVDPVLNSLSRHMQDPENKYPQSIMNLDTKLDPETANQLKGYLQQTKSQMSEAKNTASTSAQMRRDFSLHNYNKRYGFDQYLGFPYPYEFFYTRAMSKWGLRILERPNILKNYALMRSIGNNYAKGYPTRLKGKVPMKFPYMPEGGGDYMFVDPLKKANPWVNMFLRPMEVLSKDKNMTEKRATSIIYEQMREGSITEEAGTTIIDEKKGEEWDRAMEIASAEIDSDISNPYEMINTIISPNIFIDWIYKGLTGQKEKISQLPFTRLVQNATAALGVGPEGGINLEGGIRKTLGMPEVDRFYDFKVDAQLAYMAADKLITADEAEAAMMNRSDQNYILAQEMAGKISAVRYPFSMFGADVYPSGELRQRNLMDDYAHMWDEIHLGNEDAYDEFFEEYPEYAAWQNRFKEPEERLRDHLVDEIWNRWIELPSPAKKEAEQLFGAKFQNSFLETETRSYDSFTAEELAWYASQLGAEMPETSPDITDVTQETPQILNLPEIPPESKSAMDAYYEEVDTLFPNLNNEFDVINALPDGPDKEAIKRKTSINDFYKHKSKFLADHPELAPLMDSNMKDVVGMPQEIQEYMANYVEMKHTMFPNIDQIQYDYWSVEGYKGKKDYREKYPQLSNYWEFNRWSASQFPEAAPYILSNMTISKALFPDAKYGEFDAGAIMNEFDPQFLSPGLNDILEEHFLMGKSIPEGALSELELIWEKMGSPGTFNKFVEATRMYY